MATEYERQLSQVSLQKASFDERLSVLVESESSERHNRKLKRLIRDARLPEAAVLEDLETGTKRGIDKAQIEQLASCDWITRCQNVIINGPTGVGKTWLACAFASEACRRGLQSRFYKAGDLYEEIERATHAGGMADLKRRLCSPRLLIIDDFGLGEFPKTAAQTLADVVDKRIRTGSLILTSQYPTEEWHKFFSDEAIADAFLDRVVHQSHVFRLKGESMRKLRAKAPRT